MERKFYCEIRIVEEDIEEIIGMKIITEKYIILCFYTIPHQYIVYCSK